MSEDFRPASKRISREQYYMGIAIAVRERANCLGRRVGAILVRDDRVIATGYNGTPSNMLNCDEGGCFRCKSPDQFPAGTGYDQCICVHAEQNALMTAARFGIALDGSMFYSTMRPCFGCTKEMLQAGIKGGHYLHDWVPAGKDLLGEYVKIQNRFTDGIRRIEMDDPRGDWWKGRGAAATTAQEMEADQVYSAILNDEEIRSFLRMLEPTNPENDNAPD